jgi:cell wall-associated NlpC family hydrolase
VKRSVLIVAGVALSLSPLIAIGVAATGLTIVSAAVVPSSCQPPDIEGPFCFGTSQSATNDASLPSLPNSDDGTGGQAALVAVAAVGRGGRYVAEGNGPVDFDCSGLTAWAWRQVGVSLPDYSYSQWDVTARISREQLQPGDLVFWFGGDVHHVAIVVAVDVGRVRIAEAANPDAGVRIRDFGDSWDQRYVSGYGRVDHR